MYLTEADRALLDKAAAAAGESRAEIMRRGIRRIAVEVLNAEPPMLTFLREMQSHDWPDESMPPGRDPQEWFEQELERSVLDTHEPTQ